MNFRNAFKVFLTAFLMDASSYGRIIKQEEIIAELKNLAHAEGKSEKINNHWIVTIDSVFYHEFEGKPDVIKKLIYHELAHIYLNLKDSDENNIMNSANLYTTLKDKDVRYLFGNDLKLTYSDSLVSASATNAPLISKEELCKAISQSNAWEYEIDEENEMMTVRIKLAKK